jgi:hypothetical protein
MQPHLQRVEREGVAQRNEKFAVEDKVLLFEACERTRDFREVAAERLSGFRAQFDTFVATKGKTAKTVPFGLELPAAVFRQRRYQARFHGTKLFGRQRVALPGSFPREKING